MGAAFLPAPSGWLAWFALVPLFAALGALQEAGARPRRLFAAGYLYGLVFYVLGLHWVALLTPVAMTVPWLRYPGWLAAAAYLALFAGLSAWLAGWLARRARFPFGLALPVAFLAVEELRGAGELGFPWFQLGYSQHAFLPVVQLAALGSVSLVTLWVLGLNVLAWRAALPRPGRGLALAGGLALLALPWSWGSQVLRAAPEVAGPAVALVQGDVGTEMKWSPERQGEVLARFLRLSARAAQSRPRPVLLIWPETATGSYLIRQLDQRLEVARFLSGAGVPLLTGYPDYTRLPDGRVRATNSAGLIDTLGRVVAQYDKRHLVPFGERLPFQGLFPALGKLDLGQAEWAPGRESVLFPSAAGPFGCLICFEAIFPDLAREDVRHGARWLVNVTNDAWFGRSAALEQHAAMAVFRAVENRVTLARCGNTGLTFVVDPWGRRHARLPAFEQAVGVAAVTPPGPRSGFTRFGDWPLGLVLLVLAWGALRALRSGTGAASGRV
jgi:apolipoprotein N-acyltransferase